MGGNLEIWKNGCFVRLWVKFCNLGILGMVLIILIIIRMIVRVKVMCWFNGCFCVI